MRIATLFTELILATALLAAACNIAPKTLGAVCKITPCTLYDHGAALHGHCGPRKGDDKNCYCIANTDANTTQEQLGCEPNAN